MKIPSLSLIQVLLIHIYATSGKAMGSFGYYDPYPPMSKHHVSHHFSPLDHHQSRKTRDLTWRDNVEEYLDHSKEPTCEQLREMWRLTKRLQMEGESPNVPEALRSLLTFDPIPLKSKPSPLSLKVDENELEPEFQIKADRRRMSTPTHSSAHTGNKALQLGSNPEESGTKKTQRTQGSSGTRGGEQYTYGQIRTHKPVVSAEIAHGLGVRDPAKDIFGLLKERQAEETRQPASSLLFGRTRTHQPQGSSSQLSYLDEVAHRLQQENPEVMALSDTEDDQSPAFGVVRYHDDTKSQSPFERVRALIAATRAKQSSSGSLGHKLQAEYPSADQGAAKNPYDLIRERLMNTRLLRPRGSLRKEIKSFRRKHSKKRRRNVREVAATRQRIWQDLYSATRGAANERRRKQMRKSKSQRRKAAAARRNRKHRTQKT